MMKINLQIKLLFSISVFTLSFITHAASSSKIPDDFKELYQKQAQIVKFKDIKGHVHSIEVMANFDSVQIIAPEVLKQFEQILIDNKIQEQIVQQIITDIKAGKPLNRECAGLLQSCSLIPEIYSLQYDYFSQSLYLFVNPNLVKKDNTISNDEVVYASSHKEAWGLINHVDLYANKSDSGDFNYSIYNQSTLGLSYGNIDSEFYYQNSNQNDEFELDRLYYNYEFERYRMILGLNRDQLEINSTDFLASNSLNKEIALTFATSNNMQLGRSTATQKIFYFAPNDGVLTVSRNGRIIYQKNVPTGQGFITNDELPSGRYTAIFEIISGDSVISREVHTIYNNAKDTLAVGNYDFTVTGGMLKNTNSNDDEDNNLDEEGFGRALIAYRPIAPLTLGAGTMVINDDQVITLGMRSYLPFDASLDLMGQYFTQGDMLYNINLDVYGFGLYFEDFNHADGSILADYMYGNSSYRQTTISRSFAMPYDIQGYVNYNLYENDGNDDFNEIKTQSISTGLTIPAVWSSTLRLNADFNFETNSQSDDFHAQVVWTLPLNQLLSFETRLETNRDNIQTSRNSLRTDNLLTSVDGAYANVQVGHTYYPQNNQDDSILDASTNLTYTNDKVTASAYGFIDSKQNYSTNFNLSSSQIVSPNTLAFSSTQANSYLVVNSGDRVKNRFEDDVKGLLVLTKDKTSKTNQYIYDDTQAIPLRDYASYNAYLDTSSVDLESEGDTTASIFSMPGSVQTIDSKIVRVLSFISGFKDVLETPVSNIECTGEGCVSQTQVTDGIYKITVQEGESFKLFSDDLVCYIPKVDTAKMFNFGENYCIPNIEPAEYVITHKKGQPIKLTYVGGFEPQDYKDMVKQKLVSLQLKEGIEVVEKSLGDFVYIYLASDAKSELTAQQISFVNSIQSYAARDTLSSEKYNYNLVKR